MSSASVGTAGNVYFGVGYPSVVPALLENDTYFHTSNGLSSGVIIDEFIYDSSGWILVPSGGGSTPATWANTSW